MKGRRSESYAINEIMQSSLRVWGPSQLGSISLKSKIPPVRHIVTESGIRTLEDVEKIRKEGISRFLVGEAFMRAADPGKKLNELFF